MARLRTEPQAAADDRVGISEDGLRYGFHLRRGLKWQNGRDFTSDDVAPTIFRLQVAHPHGRITHHNVIAVDSPIRTLLLSRGIVCNHGWVARNAVAD